MKLTQPRIIRLEYECSNRSDIDQIILDISEYIKKGYTLIGVSYDLETKYRCNNIYTIKIELVYAKED